MSEKNLESRLRKKLAKQGYALRKSRVKNINADNLGGYMILLAYCNGVIAGQRFSMSLDDVEQYVCDYA